MRNHIRNCCSLFVIEADSYTHKRSSECRPFSSLGLGGFIPCCCSLFSPDGAGGAQAGSAGFALQSGRFDSSSTHPPLVIVEDVVGTQTPFCSIALVPQTPFVVVEDVVGTQTPFCSIALVPQTLDEPDVPKF